MRAGVLVGVCGCVAPSAIAPNHVEPVPPVATLTGTVVFSDGAPAGPGTITATNTATHERIVIAVDTRGQFSASPPTGDYALAITSPGGFVFVDHQRTQAQPLSLWLSRGCHVVHGAVANSTPGAQIALVRTSDTSAVFTAIVDDGGFEICLPEGDYRALSRAIHVPAATPIHLDATRRELAKD